MTPNLEIDFLIIGAAKSATTWLQRSLQLDPNVFMPDPELHFFSREFGRGYDWYLSHFAPALRTQITGEKSNSYLDSPEAARRIHAAMPSAKLIVQLRNPVERAYSDYCMLFRRGEVSGDIDRYLDPRHSDIRFLVGGLYFKHLERYLHLWRPEDILLLLFEDMKAAPTHQVFRTRRFLGLEDVGSSTTITGKVKDKTTPVLSPTLKRLLGPIKPLIRPLRKSPQFRVIRGLFAREMKYPPLRAELRSRLVDFYRADSSSIGALMGRDMTDWLESSHREPAGDGGES